MASPGFNRNILGCKVKNGEFVEVKEDDLIETYWDVKTVPPVGI